MIIHAAAAIGVLCGWATNKPITVLDAFGRDVSDQPVVLLDWEGHLANPAIRLTASFEPSANRRFLDIRSDCVRLIFDKEGDLSTGPLGKAMRIEPGQTKADFWMGTFPDRDGQDEEHTLELRLRDETAWTPVKVRVVDQDRPRNSAFAILADFSQDQTGFLKEPGVQKVIRQAVDDWAFFLADMGFDAVREDDESTTLWTPEGFVRAYTVKNQSAYRGFLIYFTGIRGPELRSGGAPSHHGRRQTADGKELPLLRSGAVELELQGSYTKYGWHVGLSDEAWWVSGSQISEPADLYSIVMHEIGHAIGFEKSYPKFGEALRKGRFDDSGLRAYLGFEPGIDAFGHLDRCIDPASGFGAFGAEYQAKMKVRRWLITKTHLLMLQAVGYKLAPLSCFKALGWERQKATLKLGQDAGGLSLLSGGMPTYRCYVAEGRLPKGLTVGEFDGKLYGTPQEEGTFEVWLEAADQSPQGAGIRGRIFIEVVR